MGLGQPLQQTYPTSIQSILRFAQIDLKQQLQNVYLALIFTLADLVNNLELFSLPPLSVLSFENRIGKLSAATATLTQ